MKISSASKKVLASALSAAMVVAFAPTVAFGLADGQTATLTVIANDGITVIIRLRDGSEHALPVAQADGSRPFIPIGKQVAFMPEALTRRQATYMLTPKWKVLLSGLAISLLFLIISVMVYFERFI